MKSTTRHKQDCAAVLMCLSTAIATLISAGCAGPRPEATNPPTLSRDSTPQTGSLKAWITTDTNGVMWLHFSPPPKTDTGPMFSYVRSPTPIPPNADRVEGDVYVMLIHPDRPTPLNTVAPGYYRGMVVYYEGKAYESEGHLKQDVTSKSNPVFFEIPSKSEKKMATADSDKPGAVIPPQDDFLSRNAKQTGVRTLQSGLQYKVLAEGAGDSPGASDTVTVHYRGTLIDGTEFDSSYGRGRPATFRLSQVIRGWREGLQLMKPGAKYQLFIPSDLAYGERGYGKIGPNAALIFEVELLSVQRK